MKSVIVASILLVSSSVFALDRSLNPDKYPSIGLDVSGGKLAGILKDVPAGAPATDGGFVKGLLDLRMPISNAVTLHGFASSTGLNNNKQFSEGSEVGFGLRVYIQ